MKLPSPIVAGSIAIGVFAAGFGIGHIVTNDSGSTRKAAGKPHVLGQVFAHNPGASTSTTVATPAPVSPGTSNATTATTAAQPSVGTQTRTTTVAQGQTTSPPATTTVAIQNGACGSGTASAQVSSQTHPTSNSANTDYETDIVVTVKNGINKPIQIDSLSVHLVYDDGSTQDVVFNSAIGNVLQPGATNDYGVNVNTGKRQVATMSMQSFTFHTAGHPECAGRTS